VATVRPFLLFQGNAEAAMTFYVSLIPGSQVIEVARYGPGAAGAEGSIMKAIFSVGGQAVMCTDSTVRHEFTFTPAFSFFIDCESDAQIEQLASALSQDGAVFMPLGEYGFSRRFAWVNDRFGVSWQLNLQ
jgi:predicted 3-demethylubiquinone-9 3-methyltransferase (glyoxalase superfamily)